MATKSRLVIIELSSSQVGSGFDRSSQHGATHGEPGGARPDSTRPRLTVPGAAARQTNRPNFSLDCRLTAVRSDGAHTSLLTTHKRTTRLGEKEREGSREDTDGGTGTLARR